MAARSIKWTHARKLWVNWNSLNWCRGAPTDYWPHGRINTSIDSVMSPVHQLTLEDSSLISPSLSAALVSPSLQPEETGTWKHPVGDCAGPQFSPQSSVKGLQDSRLQWLLSNHCVEKLIQDTNTSSLPDLESKTSIRHRSRESFSFLPPYNDATTLK